jgi:UDP-N-acetylglucosamine 1-carboxyvinyltransferase
VITKRAAKVEANAEIEAKVAATLWAIGVRIKEARQRAGMTQIEAAAKAGTPPSYIFEIETGLQNLTIRSLTKIAYALGVELRDLLPEVRSEPPTPAAIDLLCQILERVAKVVADFEVREGKRQQVQAEMVEQLNAFADMRPGLQQIRLDHAEKRPPSRPPKKR